MRLFLDIETFHDSKNKYDLRHMSQVEYCRHELFFYRGVGYAFDDQPIRWVSKSGVDAWVKSVPWSEIEVIAQNTKFDLLALSTTHGVRARQYSDTKAMSKAVLAKSIKGHGIKDLAEYYGLPPKMEMKTDGLRELTVEQEKELADYCIHDVELCRDIYRKLVRDFPASQYAPMHRTIDMFVNPKLVLNVPLLEKTAKEEAARRENIFKEIGIEKAEFASNAKFPDLLRSRGFDVPVKTSPRTGKEIPALALGDPEFLEMLETKNEELKTLCEARVAAKSTLLETRSAKLAAIGGTGNWPFDVEFSGADQTHRFSGGSGAGGNPQNFTRDSALREAVEAPEGYSLVVGDFANIELRIVAYLSKDPGLVQAIENNVDIYCDFASVFYGRKITKADGTERRFGKTAILGLGYGMGMERFIKTVRVQTGETISEKDSRKAVDLYRSRYAKVPALWERLDKSISTMLDSGRIEKDLAIRFLYRGIQLPSGLIMRYPNLRQVKEGRHTEWVYDVYNKRNLEHRKLYGGKLLENISQALAGELCKEAMLKIGANVTGLVHDEIHAICRKGLETVAVQAMKRVMTVSPKWLPTIKLDAEVGWGKSWGSAK